MRFNNYSQTNLILKNHMKTIFFKNSFILTIIFININSLVFSQKYQKTQVVNELKKVFFNIPLNPDKFVVRNALNRGSNFTNYNEVNYSGYVTANFDVHDYLNYIVGDKKIVIWFRDSNFSVSRKIYIDYKLSDIGICENQYKELNDIFKPISYKVSDFTLSKGDERTGIGTHFYANSTFFKADKPFLEISYRYISSYQNYFFEIILKEEYL